MLPNAETVRFTIVGYQYWANETRCCQSGNVGHWPHVLNSLYKCMPGHQYLWFYIYSSTVKDKGEAYTNPKVNIRSMFENKEPILHNTSCGFVKNKMGWRNIVVQNNDKRIIIHI